MSEDCSVVQLQPKRRSALALVTEHPFERLRQRLLLHEWASTDLACESELRAEVREQS